MIALSLSSYVGPLPSADAARARTGPKEPRKSSPHRVLIIGAGDTGQMIATEMLGASRKLKGSKPVEVVGFLDDQPEGRGLPGVPILGGTHEIERVMRQQEVDEIVIAYVPNWYQTLLNSVANNGCSHPEVRVVPGLYEAMIGKAQFQQLQEIPLISLNGRRTSRFMQGLRRVSDLLLAGLLLTLFAPVMLLAALLVRLTSRGPVILRQERVGKDGKPFVMYKFRTMWADAEAKTGPILARPHDGRCTPVGRILRASKIDEMPQFINVLKGEMSLVGPRPERPAFVQQYEVEVPGYRLRHSVKPGITGLAQIYAGYLINVHDKLKYDLMYVSNQSLLLDWKIVALTPVRTLLSFYKQTVRPGAAPTVEEEEEAFE